jgi:hypothetical protein
MRKLMDERMMLNQTEITGALEALKHAKAVEYTAMSANEARRQYGITGQSIKDVLPDATETDGLGNVNLDLTALVPPIVAALQEVAERLEKLESKRRGRASSAPEKAEETPAD